MTRHPHPSTSRTTPGRPRRPAVRPGDLRTAPGRHLIGLDLDGTTVQHDGTLRAPVRDAVRATEAAGHEIVVATGRSLIAALPTLREIGLQTGYAVCSNGAVVLRLGRDAGPRGWTVLREHTFDPAPALRALRDAWPEGRCAVERVGLGFDVAEPFPDGALDGRVRVVPWDDLVAHPTTRLTFYRPDADADEFAREVERIGLHEVTYSVGFTAWLDVMAAGVSKASGLERVRELLGVPHSRTVAVGDQRNDLEMLRWAACGVAMGSAPLEVQRAADLVTGHVDDDGLADVLAALPDARATGAA